MGRRYNRGRGQHNNYPKRSGHQPANYSRSRVLATALKSKKSIIDYPVDWLRKIKPTIYPSHESHNSVQRALEGIRKEGQLVLEKVALTEDMYKQILQELKSTPKSLTKLSLTHTTLDNQDGERLIQQLQPQQTFKFIALANNKLFTPEIFLSFIDKVLKNQPELEELYLIQTVGSLGNEVLKQLAGYLAEQCPLKKLGIIDKNLDKEGLQELIKGLKRNDRLEVLHLSECSGLGDSALSSLSELLKQKNCILKEIHLNNTNAGNETVLAIAEALRHNGKMETLELRYNQFDATAAEALRFALIENTHLRDLDICYNRLPIAIAELFIEHMQRILEINHQLLAGNTEQPFRIMPRIKLFNEKSSAPTKNKQNDDLIVRAQSCMEAYDKIENLIPENKPNQPKTYLFYDLETTGLNLAFDQITQFAAVKTDTDLRVLETYNYRIKLNPDVVPHPAAFRTHGINPFELNQNGRSENEVMLQIYSLFQATTQQIGYNSVHFDSKVLRFSFYRNFLPAYIFDKIGLDIYPVVVMFYLLRYSPLTSNNICWPLDGSLKLADIITANPVENYQRDAHDALVDVQDTLNIARLLSSRRDVFEPLMEQFDGLKLTKRLTKLYTRPTPQRYAILLEEQQISYCYLLFYKGVDYKSKQSAADLSLANEETVWINLTKENLFESVKTSQSVNRLILRRKKVSQQFIFIDDDNQTIQDGAIYTTLKTLITSEQQKLFDENIALLSQPLQLTQITAWVKQSLKDFKSREVDSDADLYVNIKNSYWPNAEINGMLHGYLNARNIEERLAALNELLYCISISKQRERLARLICRNYPEHANPEQKRLFEAHMRKIIDSDSSSLLDYKGQQKFTPNDAMRRIHEEIKINQSKLSRKEKQLFEELRRYIRVNFWDKRIAEPSSSLVDDNPFMLFQQNLEKLKRMTINFDAHDAETEHRLITANTVLSSLLQTLVNSDTSITIKRNKPDSANQQHSTEKRQKIDPIEISESAARPISPAGSLLNAPSATFFSLPQQLDQPLSSERNIKSSHILLSRNASS